MAAGRQRFGAAFGFIHLEPLLAAVRFASLIWITSSDGALLAATPPLMAAGWRGLSGREQPTARRPLGMAVGLLGTAICWRCARRRGPAQTLRRAERQKRAGGLP